MPFPCNDDRCDEAKQSTWTFRKDRTHTVLVFAHTLCLNVTYCYWTATMCLNVIFHDVTYFKKSSREGCLHFEAFEGKILNNNILHLNLNPLASVIYAAFHSKSDLGYSYLISPTWYLSCLKFERLCIWKYNGNATVCCTDLDCQKSSSNQIGR